MPPRAAVIIPLYNKAPYLPRALDAVRAQTMRDWECIVVDDGSTDGGARIVREQGDPRIRLIAQANHGPGHARNRGVEASQAGILAFLDADDAWDADYLETQIEPLLRDPTVAATVCAHRRAGTETSLEGYWSAIAGGAWRLPTETAPADVKRAVDAMHTGSTVVRRDVFERCQGFYESNRCTYGEDTWLWIQVLFGHVLWRDPRMKMSYHVEASVLGLGRATPYPPWPMLLEPDPVLRTCPASHVALLEATLAYYALIAASRSYRAGNRREAVEVLRRVRRRVAADNPEVSGRLRRELIRIQTRWPFFRVKRLARALLGSSKNAS